ncbi:hypothetical protein NEMBOFW57_003560 [Staphylotrichum longicolle]|uniref:Tyrosinase copper-binding domain-containing protein n=1 Tax=Staphylotrichum longicolle TaxID=669026 RepID=A0AAD4I5V0_9PEZI|nr:hypothetical protein NEMBOFW57_003560 [Staphylotrichum longicolle]
MKFVSFITGLLSLAALSSAAPGYGQGGGHDAEAAASKQIDRLQKQYQKYIRDTIKTRQTGCTSKNILRRREWGSLSKADRRSYIDAVYCLYHNQSFVTPLSEIPGVRNRYDDFVGGHLQLTPFVHADGLFLPFHRFYVHLYETALRTECGYRGAQPYWDWTLSYTDPAQSTVFDGSPWSLGSNGVFVPGRSPITVAGAGFTRTFPPATGGGCVYSGPFTPDKFQLHLGPIAFEPAGPQGGLGYNPRCLSRDLSPDFASGGTRPTNVTRLLACEDLACVNVRFDDPVGGVHGYGHFLVGGIQLDVFASPSDPVFWLHHAQIDRLWTIWQNLGRPEEQRTQQVWGTQTAANTPPSDNVTLDTLVPFGRLSPSKPVRELVSTVDGPFCYIYE